MLLVSLALASSAWAQSVDDGGTMPGADMAAPLACDGSLCDTTNGACAVGGVGARAPATPVGWIALGALVAASLFRRRRDLLLALVLVRALAPAPARAEPEPAVDVTIHEPPPPARHLVIAYNPLPLILGRVSFDVIFVPKQHHALLVSPFYASASTAGIFIFDDQGNPTQLSSQRFAGGGGELGYRYYFGKAGPRGFFVGPSLILGWFDATAGDGTKTKFMQYGGAADIGYQMLIASRFSLAFGGGLEIVGTDKKIPQQQFPARVFANFSVLPRLLVSLGVAL